MCQGYLIGRVESEMELSLNIVKTLIKENGFQMF